MMTAPIPTRKPLATMLPPASILIKGRMYPAEIRAAAFQGGILETQAEIAKGTLVPLKLMSDPPATLNVHVLEVSEHKMIFRLYGTDGHAQTIWEQIVADLRDRQS